MLNGLSCTISFWNNHSLGQSNPYSANDYCTTYMSRLETSLACSKLMDINLFSQGCCRPHCLGLFIREMGHPWNLNEVAQLYPILFNNAEIIASGRFRHDQFEYNYFIGTKL